MKRYPENPRTHSPEQVAQINGSIGEFGWTTPILVDAVLATAILDRLLHHWTTINIKGQRYRLKSKRKAGVLNAPVKEEEGKAATG